MNTQPIQALVPLLVVQRARDAIDFYVNALGATVTSFYEHGREKHVSHADLVCAVARFAVTEEARAWNSDAPPTLGGSPVVLQLEVTEIDAVVDALVAAGASVVFPVQELLGERMARLRDPFGHLWLLRQKVQQLSSDQIQRQRDELFALATASSRRTPESTGHPLPKDPTSVCDAVPLAQATRPGRGRVHVVLGPVGAGKSTFARKLAGERCAVRLTLDEWMTELFSPDRPEHHVVEWYRARAARCVDRLEKLTWEIAQTGTDVVLEVGLLTRRQRLEFYQRSEERGLDLRSFVLDAARDVRRARVLARNQERGETFSMVVPLDFFELASDAWEPPEPDEVRRHELSLIRTDLP